MTSLAFILLIVVAARLLRSYGLLAVIHPGLWFSVAWITAFLSYWALDAAGGVPVYSPDVLDQLMVQISVTAVAFAVLTIVFPRPPVIRGASNKFRGFFLENAGHYRLFSIIGLAGATVNWMALGANFGYDDSIRQQWLYAVPTITAYTWYMYFLSYPAAIIGGRMLFSSLLRGGSFFQLKSFYWILPVIAGFLWSMGTGGRQALGLILFHYVIGAAFGLGWAAANGFKMQRRCFVG